MVGVGLVAVGAAYAVGPDPEVLRVGLMAILPGAVAGVCGAAVTVVSEAILESSQEAFIPPEVAGPRLLFRTVWPPLIAVIGLVPVLVARGAARDGTDPVVVVATTAVPVALLCAVVFLVGPLPGGPAPVHGRGRHGEVPGMTAPAPSRPAPSPNDPRSTT